MAPIAPPPARPKVPTWAIVLVLLVIGAVPGLGIFGALGIFGFRRYLAASKTAEAKATVQSISVAAVAAYEREIVEVEGSTHRLCGSSAPVPSDLAKVAARKYQPSTVAGEDFDSGDENTGWKCLRFSLAHPIRYQYGYSVGGGFVGPAVAGPGTFEASALGDLDGNGVLGKFARSGHVKASGDVVLDTTIWTDNESE